MSDHSKIKKVCVHKGCGGAIVSELIASDAERDYYAAYCLACGASPETRDMKYVPIDGSQNEHRNSGR